MWVGAASARAGQRERGRAHEAAATSAGDHPRAAAAARRATTASDAHVVDLRSPIRSGSQRPRTALESRVPGYARPSRVGPGMELIHTCYRITDPERSIAFYEALGLEKRRELPIRDEAMNYFLGVPGKEQPELELTYNFGVDAYEIGTGYGHIALTIDDMAATLAALAEKGIEPERPPYSRPRRRLAALLRPRPGRLPHRADRAVRLLAETCPSTLGELHDGRLTAANDLDQPVGDRVLPDREPRAVRLPDLHRLGVLARPRRDPGKQILRPGVDRP